MATQNRTTQITHMLKVIKKHFKPVKVETDRNVLEQLLFACCLENSEHADAQSAFDALKERFFDWNEVRVTTVRELAEVTKDLVDSDGAAMRLRRTLQNIFESIYTFDLEILRKENLGKATETLDKYPGTTPFVVAFVVQTSLGGHSIPVNRGLLWSFHILGIIDDKEFQQGTVPGLERAVPKSKGIEVGTIFHQLGVMVGKNPYNPTLRKILVEIEPDCKDRLPKRPAPKKAAKKKKSATKKSTKKKTAAATATTRSGSAVKKTAKTKSTAAAKKKVKKKSSSKQLAKRKPR